LRRGRRLTPRRGDWRSESGIQKILFNIVYRDSSTSGDGYRSWRRIPRSWLSHRDDHWIVNASFAGVISSLFRRNLVVVENESMVIR